MLVTAQLSLEGLRYFVGLGCSEAERAHPQEIHVSVCIGFAEIPAACQTDLLEDTLCYADIEGRLNEVCQTKDFKTVEHLAYLCWQAVSSFCKRGEELVLKVRKVHPPIGRPNEGATVEIKGRP